MESSTFCFIKDRLLNLTCALDFVQQKDSNAANLSQEASIKGEIQEQLIHEQSLWPQRSRVEWLVSKDLNTKICNASMVIRRNRNSILSLQLDDLSWTTGRQNVGNTITTYFEQFFCFSILFSHLIWEI